MCTVYCSMKPICPIYYRRNLRRPIKMARYIALMSKWSRANSSVVVYKKQADQIQYYTPFVHIRLWIAVYICIRTELETIEFSHILSVTLWCSYKDLQSSSDLGDSTQDPLEGQSFSLCQGDVIRCYWPASQTCEAQRPYLIPNIFMVISLCPTVKPTGGPWKWRQSKAWRH